MYLTRLIYYSRCDASEGIDVESILQSAREHNARNQITGALWFDGTYFIQVLEGGRKAISDTYHRIARDPRHFDIELVSCELIDRRVFNDWKMAYVSDTQPNRDLIRKYSGTDQLKPREMSAASLLNVILEGQLVGG